MKHRRPRNGKEKTVEGKQMYYDIEQDSLVSEKQLYREYVEAIARKEIDQTEISFAWYTHNCLTCNGGTLEKI